MPKTIDEFIDEIRGARFFAYAARVVNRHFMFSYDMTVAVRENYTGDFRRFVIALLHAKF